MLLAKAPLTIESLGLPHLSTTATIVAIVVGVILLGKAFELLVSPFVDKK